MRQLYQAVAVPSYTYAADIWFNPVIRNAGDKKAKGSVDMACKLTSVQCIATTAITGALHTSATDTMELHANLFLVELLMQRVCHRATLQLATLPETHPLYKLVRASAHRDVRRHRSMLHQLLHAFGMWPDVYETVCPMTHPPNRGNSFDTRIAASREVSKEEDEKDQVVLQAYSDGSGLDGEAGASAVLYWDGQSVRTLRCYLGPLTRHTTYKAELAGILLMLELIGGSSEAVTATIKLNSQAAILALGNHRAKPAHSLIDCIREMSNEWICKGCHQGTQLSIRWISGHDGVLGNERADCEAKRAISNGSSPCVDLPCKLQDNKL